MSQSKPFSATAMAGRPTNSFIKVVQKPVDFTGWDNRDASGVMRRAIQTPALKA